MVGNQPIDKIESSRLGVCIRANARDRGSHRRRKIVTFAEIGKKDWPW